MHEMSIALEICRIVQEQAGEDGCASVVAVGLEVGEMAGVEVDNLSFWLEALLSDKPFRGARPRIDAVPGDVLRVTYLEVEDGNPEDRGT